MKSRDKAITARAQRGLPVSSRIPISHKLVRDPVNGRGIRLEVSEEKRRLWDDLAELILAGISWSLIDQELYQRYGHVSDSGKPYYAHYMYRLVMKPLFWGHVARNHCSLSSKNGLKYGNWIFDASVPIPEGSTMFRDTHPPVWTGELADRIKTELKRRSEIVRGSSDPERTHRFSGLGICAECGSFLATFVSGGYRGLVCPASKAKNPPKFPPCNNRGVMNERKVIARMNVYLKQMLESHSIEVFQTDEEQHNNTKRRLEALHADINLAEEQARILIRQQSKAGEALQALYEEELTQVNSRLHNMRSTYLGMQSQVISEYQTTAIQAMTLKELAILTLDAFWKQESRYINQVLHRLMGKHRIQLLKGDIIGVAMVNRRQRRHA